MRELEADLLEWFDDKLAKNGLAQEAIATKNARLLFGLAAESCVGIRETGGNNNGPMVRLLQKTIGGAVKEPWCMSFVQSCLAYAEAKTGEKSPVIASEHCQTVWTETPRSQRVKTAPLKYAIVIWAYEGTSSGHTGVVVESFYPKKFHSVEGNTGDDGGRDGDCVTYKKRDWVRSGKLRVLGFLKPF